MSSPAGHQCSQRLRPPPPQPVTIPRFAEQTTMLLPIIPTENLQPVTHPAVRPAKREAVVLRVGALAAPDSDGMRVGEFFRSENTLRPLASVAVTLKHNRTKLLSTGQSTPPREIPLHSQGEPLQVGSPVGLVPVD